MGISENMKFELLLQNDNRQYKVVSMMVKY